MATPSGLRRRAIMREAVLVLLGLLVVSVAIRLFDLDRRISGAFYQQGRSPEWLGRESPFWDAVYHAAVWPANVVAGAALLVFLASFIRPALRRHRRSCAMLVLSLALGPGLLVNGVFKPALGRPRPRDVVEFGGTETYHPMPSIDLAGKGKAFPSGHASMGFYFFVLVILWRKSRPRAARAAFASSLAAGGLIGLQRIVVGAHFPTDVIGAAGVGYLVPLCLDAMPFTSRFWTAEPPRESPPPGERAPRMH